MTRFLLALAGLYLVSTPVLAANPPVNVCDPNTGVCLHINPDGSIDGGGAASPASFLPTQVTIATTSTLIVAARTGRVSVTVENTSATTEYVGPSGVTTSTGFPIPAGQALSVATTAALYGVAASSASAAEYETF